jgi:UDP-N-acetylmuramoylalanine--D-glutamate ligase
VELKQKRVLVVGAGVSGEAAARLCLGQGARVAITDQGAGSKRAGELESSGAELHFGGFREEDFISCDLLVLSPGIDPRLFVVRKAVARGIPVIGEMELGFRFLKAPSIMVTGTNGKSTVTTLIGLLLEAEGYEVFTGGNLGEPLCSLINSGRQVDWAVLEVSSFQADTAPTMSPKVGVLLNITEDHLNRYENFTAYGDSKFSFFLRQGPEDIAICKADDREIAKRIPMANAQVQYFSETALLRPGGWLEGDDLVISVTDQEQMRIDASQTPLQGTFNRLNLLAACMAAKACAVRPDAMHRVIREFKGLPHRVELVGTLDQVDFVNDSKATNVGAVQAALASLDRDLILLLGGRDKKGNFADLAPFMGPRLKGLICFGEAGQTISEQLEPFYKGHLVSDLPGAFELSRELARPGDMVLLSPGCASFDAYKSYGQRGDHFRSLVLEALSGD